MRTRLGTAASESGSLVRVALLHDARPGLQALINTCTAEPTLAVVSLQSTATTRQVIGACPDVVVIDSHLDNALGICKGLADDASVSVIFIDVPRDGGFAPDALRAGARGLVFEGDSDVDVLRAIQMVHAGGVWASHKTVLAALDTPGRAERERRQAAARMVLDRLSAREIEVMRHAAAGLGNKELAERLSISRSTVKAHLTHIFQKLRIQGRVELAAMYHRLVPSSDFDHLVVAVPPAASIRKGLNRKL